MNCLTAIAILAGIVWSLAFALRGSMISGCLVFLVLTCCFGHEFLNFDLGPIPLTLDRIWVMLLVAMYVVQRAVRNTDPKPLAATDWLLAAFVALVAVSTFVAGALTQSSIAGVPLWHLAVGYVFPALIYWIARQSHLSEKPVVAVQGFLTLFGIYLAVIGIFEMTAQWSLVFPKYIADPNVGLHYGRARGPMVQSVSYGLYVGVSLIALLIWQLRFGRGGKLALTLLAPLLLAAAVLTLTRSVWMGTALALFVFSSLILRESWRKLVLFSMLGAVLVVAMTKSDSLLGFEREGSSEFTRSSAESRASFAYVSWKMFVDRPILGFGFGQFPEAKWPYLDDRSTDLNLEIIRPLSHHNTYLSLLVELGLLGFTLYMLLLASWARAAWRLYRGDRRPAWVQAHGALTLCALATYAIQMMFHDVSYTSIDNSLIFLLGGLTVGLSYSGSDLCRSDRGRAGDNYPQQQCALEHTYTNFLNNSGAVL
jgi:O-antigen ligase